MKLMKLVAVVTIALLVFVPLVLWLMGIKPPRRVAPGPPLPPIARIQAMSDLATTRVQISDYIQGENKHYAGKWILQGEAVLGVDLSKATYVTIKQEDRVATLLLPVPRLIASKVDHERSEELYVKRRRVHSQKGAIRKAWG